MIDPRFLPPFFLNNPAFQGLGGNGNGLPPFGNFSPNTSLQAAQAAAAAGGIPWPLLAAAANAAAHQNAMAQQLNQEATDLSTKSIEQEKKSFSISSLIDNAQKSIGLGSAGNASGDSSSRSDASHESVEGATNLSNQSAHLRCTSTPLGNLGATLGLSGSLKRALHSPDDMNKSLESDDDDDGDESGTSGGKKARKARTIFTDKQLQQLEDSFEKQKYLSVQDRMELAQRLGLSDTQVKTWYQNRRTKWKRQTAVGMELLAEAGNYAAVQQLLRSNPYWAPYFAGQSGPPGSVDPSQAAAAAAAVASMNSNGAHTSRPFWPAPGFGCMSAGSGEGPTMTAGSLPTALGMPMIPTSLAGLFPEALPQQQSLSRTPSEHSSSHRHSTSPPPNLAQTLVADRTATESDAKVGSPKTEVREDS